MKDIHFMVQLGEDEYVSTYDGKIYNKIDCKNQFSKRGVNMFSRLITDNVFFKYDVCAEEEVISLNVYKGHYSNGVHWEKIYSAYASLKKIGLDEEGDCDLDFWHEYFATYYASRTYDEMAVLDFEMNDSMKELRKVFRMELQLNPFIFLSKYRNMKKYSVRYFDDSAFMNIPMQKINRHVGNEYNGEKINYAIQHEVEISGDTFFDIKVLTGQVENGIINVEEMHRIFLTSGYWFSPDGGDIGVLVQENTHGKVFWNKMKNEHPELMLEKYNGEYKYAYILSKGFIPCFEILAKAGYETAADAMMLDWYQGISDKSFWKRFNFSINIWGKNDREIFGFKISKLKNFTDDCYVVKKEFFIRGENSFCLFIENVKTVIKKYEAALTNYGKIDYDFLYFLSHVINLNSKTIEYFIKIGFNKIDLYNDYINMCSRYGVYSGGLYPLNLKHEHDVMVAYMNQMRAAKNNKAFNNVVSTEDYLKLLYDGNSTDCYCILAPREANDLVNESYKLSHCVRSYIESVSMGSKKIYFLREKDRKSSPLITIEVRGDNVYQARGKSNRDPNSREMEFIKKWADYKKLSTDRLNAYYM